MGKEDNQEAGQVSHEERSTAELVKERLQERILSGGLAVSVASREFPAVFTYGKVQDVRENSAWISITINDCMIRTHTMEDRKKFLAWVEGGATAAFGTQRDHLGLIGPGGAMFTCQHGQLPPDYRPDEEQPAPGFRSRAAARAPGRRAMV